MEEYEEWRKGFHSGQITFDEVVQNLYEEQEENEQLQAVNVALQTEVAQGQQYFSEVAKAREALRLARDSFAGTHEANKQLHAENERLKEENRRIPVSERLPKSLVDVVIFSKGIKDWSMGHYVKNKGWFNRVASRYTERVTHWKPVI